MFAQLLLCLACLVAGAAHASTARAALPFSIGVLPPHTFAYSAADDASNAFKPVLHEDAHALLFQDASVVRLGTLGGLIDDDLEPMFLYGDGAMRDIGAVPEPTALVLLLGGLLMVGAGRYAAPRPLLFT